MAVEAAAIKAAPAAAMGATEADKAVVATMVAGRGTRRPKNKSARRNKTKSATASRDEAGHRRGSSRREAN